MTNGFRPTFAFSLLPFAFFGRESIFFELVGFGGAQAFAPPRLFETRFLVGFLLSFAESALALAESLGELRQAAAAEEKKYDDEDDDPLPPAWHT
jgi:hypothetical protein